MLSEDEKRQRKRESNKLYREPADINLRKNNSFKDMSPKERKNNGFPLIVVAPI